MKFVKTVISRKAEKERHNFKLSAFSKESVETMTSKKDSFYSGADKCDFACLVLAAVKHTAESTGNVPNKTGTLCTKWNFLWFGFYLPRKQPEKGCRNGTVSSRRELYVCTGVV